MSITVKEKNRIDGGIALVEVIDGTKEVQTGETVDKLTKKITKIMTTIDNAVYARYVNAAEWDADPEAIVANISEHLKTIAIVPIILPAVKKTAVTLTDKQVKDKLNAIATRKVEEAAKKEADIKAAAIKIAEEQARSAAREEEEKIVEVKR